MTTIAVRRVKNKILLAGDTRTVGDTTILSDSTDKIRKINANLGYGGAGAAKSAILMDLFIDKMPVATLKGLKSGIDLLELYATYIDFTKRHDHTTPAGDGDCNDGGGSANAVFLFIVHGVIYYIGVHDFFIVDCEYFAIGSGGETAITAMSCGLDIEQAIGVAMKRDIYTGGTIQLLEFNG